jgi:hypothetical protein
MVRELDFILEHGRDAARAVQDGGVLRGLDDGIDLRRIGPSHVVREMRLRKVERIGGERGAGAHRR